MLPVSCACAIWTRRLVSDHLPGQSWMLFPEAALLWGCVSGAGRPNRQKMPTQTATGQAGSQ